MDAIEQLSEAARRLTPDELREQLARLDQEARIIRAILRATLREQAQPRQGRKAAR